MYVSDLALHVMVNNNIIYFNFTSQYYIVLKSVVWKKGDESSQKMPS
jgi:hypothetical protein